MNIRHNPHSEQLLKEQLAHGIFRSLEEVIERPRSARATGTRHARRRTTRGGGAMLDFVKQNRVRFEIGLSGKDLIHEVHPV